MKASIVDLRYKTAQILQALDRNEEVTVLYRGKVKAVMTPVRTASGILVKSHPFFGMQERQEESVEALMQTLRKPRHVV